MAPAVVPAPLDLGDSAMLGSSARRHRRRRSGLRGRSSRQRHCGNQAGKDSLSHLNLLGRERMFAVVSRLKHDGGSAARTIKCLFSVPEQIVRILRLVEMAGLQCARRLGPRSSITQIKQSDRVIAADFAPIGLGNFG